MKTVKDFKEEIRIKEDKEFLHNKYRKDFVQERYITPVESFFIVLIFIIFCYLLWLAIFYYFNLVLVITGVVAVSIVICYGFEYIVETINAA